MENFSFGLLHWFCRRCNSTEMSSMASIDQYWIVQKRIMKKYILRIFIKKYFFWKIVIEHFTNEKSKSLSCSTRLRSDFKPYRSFFVIKKKQNGKMAVTFLKLNIFWFCFFLTISTYCETLKNEVYLPKTNFWGSLPPIQNKKYFCGNLKNTKFSKIISDRFLCISGLPYSFSGFGITSVSWNVQK